MNTGCEYLTTKIQPDVAFWQDYIFPPAYNMLWTEVVLMVSGLEQWLKWAKMRWNWAQILSETIPGPSCY